MLKKFFALKVGNLSATLARLLPALSGHEVDWRIMLNEEQKGIKVAAQVRM